MKAKKEGISQSGVGVEYSKTVSVRNDSVSVPKDQGMDLKGTKEAFNAACMDTKKG